MNILDKIDKAVNEGNAQYIEMKMLIVMASSMEITEEKRMELLKEQKGVREVEIKLISDTIKIVEKRLKKKK